ncbi:hypothetical protein B296_00035350 [Ensete ventricosum]|uniref:POX domain-containing protein n=1 Tax=Ensete ventricosum TaxID=4639 RepID=A0A427A5T1_ENSVE|nr:hypothetical protein B296_00035350 [Ensete ventricosum]
MGISWVERTTSSSPLFHFLQSYLRCCCSCSSHLSLQISVSSPAEGHGKELRADMAVQKTVKEKNSIGEGFDHHHDLLGFQAGMETLGGFPPKQQSWRLAGGFPPRDFPEASNKHRPSASPWPVEDSSLGSLFSWEGRVSVPFLNVRHSDAVAVPQPPQQRVPGDRLQIGAAYPQQQQQLFVQDGRVGFHPQQPLQLRNSKFLRPAQELLSEFCSLRGEISSKRRPNKSSLEDEEKASLSSSWNQSLHSMDLLELQKIKAKLLSMLEEVNSFFQSSLPYLFPENS